MNSRIIVVLSFLYCLVACLTSCKDAPTKQAIETPEVGFTKEGELSLFKAGTDSLLTKIDIEFAETEYETQTGLMYRSGMEDNQGMLFIFEDSRMHSFYMKNTEFALDILFINEQLKLVSFKDNAQPLDETGIPSRFPVRYVLEVNAGLREKWGLATGDSLAFDRK